MAKTMPPRIDGSTQVVSVTLLRRARPICSVRRATSFSLSSIAVVSVPLTRPVAGISIGLCTEYGDDDKIARYKLLTDILGWEDAFCDMDCKIAGTERGITGFQLDLKLKGVPHELMANAIQSASKARTEILADLVARDAQGFVLTGRDLMVDGRRPEGWPADRDPFPYETSVPGIFAAGDARHGSGKRVAAAVGEGSATVGMIHEYLQTV